MNQPATREPTPPIRHCPGASAAAGRFSKSSRIDGMESNPREAPVTKGAPGGAELSEREHEILKLVATGASNKQIAQLLVISPNTVKVHLRNIFSKIGAASRTEAALYAMREGLVQISVAERVDRGVPAPTAASLPAAAPII